MLKILHLAVVTLLMFAVPLLAKDSDEIDRAQRLFLAGDRAEALAIFTRLAEKGDVRAQMWLGVANEKLGDFHNAERWLLKAAESEDAESQFRLGILYSRERTTERKALEWIKKSADQGYKQAATALNQLKAMPQPPSATSGIVETGAYADYLAALSKQQFMLNPSALVCYKLNADSFDEQFSNAAAACRVEAVKLLPRGIHGQEQSNNMAAIFPGCLRNQLLMAAGVRDIELIECIKRINSSEVVKSDAPEVKRP